MTWRRKERWCWWWWAWAFRTSEGKTVLGAFFRHCTKNNARFLCVLSVYTRGKVERKGKIEKSLARNLKKRRKFCSIWNLFLFDAQNAYTLKLSNFSHHMEKSSIFNIFFISIRHLFTFLLNKLNLHKSNNKKHIRWWW